VPYEFEMRELRSDEYELQKIRRSLRGSSSDPAKENWLSKKRNSIKKVKYK